MNIIYSCIFSEEVKTAAPNPDIQVDEITAIFIVTIGHTYTQEMGTNW